MATPQAFTTQTPPCLGCPRTSRRGAAAHLAHLGLAKRRLEWHVLPGSIPSRTVAAAPSNTWQTVRSCSCSIAHLRTRPETKKAFAPNSSPLRADQAPKKGRCCCSARPCIVRLFKTLTATLSSSSIGHQFQSRNNTPLSSAPVMSRLPHRGRRGAPPLSLCCLQMIQLPG